MKKIGLLLFYMLALGCKSQTIYNITQPSEDRTISENYYIKDINNYNDAFVGTWRWENGNSMFEITFEEFEMYSDPLAPTIYRDDIYGKYKYIENGITIAEAPTVETFTNYKVSLGYSSPTTYSILIKDIISTIAKKGTLTLTSPNTAILELRDIGGVKVGFVPNGEFRLPTNITLTKLN